MKHGFVTVAAASPRIRVADCVFNAQQVLDAAHSAAGAGAEIICFPELCLTGYTCGDLFLQQTLQEGALDALRTVAQGTAELDALLCVGLPLLHGTKLYNTAAVLQKGRVLGFVPKTFLPNYAEFYEKRHFEPAFADVRSVQFDGQSVPFGTKLLFACADFPALRLAVEICEDLWAPVPPSCAHALAGAVLLLNLSASDETIGKAEYRRALVTGQSARLLCAYAYCDAGEGESTTDMVFAGHDLIAEDGALLAESRLFADGFALADVDVEKLTHERQKNTTFTPAGESGYTLVPFRLPETAGALHRTVSDAPFVPQDAAARAQRCEAILTMQAKGLEKRLAHAHSQTAVLGISGGLDSSLALLVTARAFDAMHKPRKDILAVTMPCFGTTKRTRGNAEALCEALGVTLRTADITNTVRSNFADIGQDEAVHDVTFENVQARVRTLVLMNLANRTGGLVVGTGDLSELALGWATYNGDHMSMYGVNASVPKTLIRHLVAYAADAAADTPLAGVLRDILATPVSPELLPAENGAISQRTEDIVGPYELHDFFLYYAIRWSFAPRRVFYLAQNAFAERYTDAELLHWLQNFYKRFFAQQFKRSCLPDGPKVGSVTLSPRGDWRMPSDACAALWLAEVDALARQHGAAEH